MWVKEIPEVRIREISEYTAVMGITDRLREFAREWEPGRTTAEYAQWLDRRGVGYTRIPGAWKPKNRTQNTKRGREEKKMANENTATRVYPAFLIYVEAGQVEALVKAVGDLDIEIHPVESQVRIDYVNDPDRPAVEFGHLLDSSVPKVNNHLNKLGWTPLIPDVNQDTDPQAAAETLDILAEWFRWKHMEPVEFTGGDTEEDWQKFAAERPAVFRQQD